MTDLTIAQINTLAAEAAGTEPTRTANKERAIAKLTAAMAAIVGQHRADAATGAILASESEHAASSALRRMKAEAEAARLEAAAPKARRAALRLIEAEAPAPEAPAKVAKEPKADKAPGKRAAMIEAAQRGELPEAPDFTPPSHKRFRKALATIIAMVEGGDIAGLKADTMEPKSSSRVMICRYRDLAIIALEARAAKAAAA